MQFTSKIEVIGVVLDLSCCHSSNKKRNVDNVKEALIDFFRSNMENQDVMYFYHPEITTTVNRVGAQVSAVANYDTEGWKFNLHMALKQTLFIVASEPYESKTLLLITDRLSDLKTIKRIAMINQKDMLDCNIVCVDIGNHLPDCDFAKIAHVADSSELTGLLREIVYGDKISTNNSFE